MPNPLQNKTLESILNELVAHYGWETLGQDIKIKTPWARLKVEDLYIATIQHKEQSGN